MNNIVANFFFISWFKSHRVDQDETTQAEHHASSSEIQDSGHISIPIEDENTSKTLETTTVSNSSATSSVSNCVVALGVAGMLVPIYASSGFIKQPSSPLCSILDALTVLGFFTSIVLFFVSFVNHYIASQIKMKVQKMEPRLVAISVTLLVISFMLRIWISLRHLLLFICVVSVGIIGIVGYLYWSWKLDDLAHVA